MNLLAYRHRVAAKLRALFHRGTLEREMQAEMAEHVERAVHRLKARGLTEEDARIEARREFGNVGVLQEEARDARGGVWLDSVRGDLRFALRQIVRRPLSSATIVCVLGLGIGMHAGMFTLLESRTLRAAPGVRIDDALVRLRGKEQGADRGRWYPRGFSYPEYRDIAARRDLFAATTAWVSEPVTIDFGDPRSATSAETHFVTDDYFAVAGVRIPLGTTLPLAARADDGDVEMAAIVSDGLWRDLLGEQATAIGRTIRVNETIVRIVGVAPPRFNGLTPSGEAHTLWMPLASRATVTHGSRQALIDRDSTLLSAAALIAPGVTMDRASAAVRVISDRAVAQMTPTKDGDIRTADVVALRSSTELPEDNDAVFAMVVFGTVGILVLLVVCTNVSAIVLGTGVARSQEIAIRLSLGASRRRLVRQLLTESCVLALAGGLAGLVALAVATRFIAQAMPDLDLSPDVRTVAFTMVIAIGAGILCGLSPALHATKRGVADVLKGGSATGSGARRRLQSSFVGAQIATTQPLLVGIGVLLALTVHRDDRPISQNAMSHVVRARMDLRSVSPNDRVRVNAVLAQVAKTPDVRQVIAEPAGIDHLNFAPISETRGDSSSAASIQVGLEGADSGYFALLDIPIVRGRDVLAGDTALRDLAVVIGSDVAHEIWGNADPIGRRFRQIQAGVAVERAAVVVGVYDGSKGTTRGTGRRVFTAGSGNRNGLSYLIRTNGPALAAIPELRERLRAALPQLPPPRLETLEDIVTGERDEIMRLTKAVAAGGALVLVLASIGLYGVIGLAVAQRQREIGVRIALGAKPGAVVRVLFAQGIRLAGIGLLIGLPLSVTALALIEQFGTGDGDLKSAGVNPAIIGGAIATIVFIVASVATWLPARRAAAVDPMIALRSE
jgi:predicted permease